jgi:hypothetical protein
MTDFVGGDSDKIDAIGAGGVYVAMCDPPASLAKMLT